MERSAVSSFATFSGLRLIVTSRNSQILVLIHFSCCPLIAFIGAAWATGFPFLPNNHYSHTIWWIQFCAIVSACVASLITAYVLRSSNALRQGRLVRHFAFLFVLLVANHFLWVEPIWGFHHTGSLGVFAWLIIGSEDGFVITPNIIGLPLTIASHWMLYRIVLGRSPVFYAVLNAVLTWIRDDNRPKERSSNS